MVGSCSYLSPSHVFGPVAWKSGYRIHNCSMKHRERPHPSSQPIDVAIFSFRYIVAYKIISMCTEHALIRIPQFQYYLVQPFLTMIATTYATFQNVSPPCNHLRCHDLATQPAPGAPPSKHHTTRPLQSHFRTTITEPTKPSTIPQISTQPSTTSICYLPTTYITIPHYLQQTKPPRFHSSFRTHQIAPLSCIKISLFYERV